MSQTKVHRKVIAILATSCVALSIAGCGPSKQVQSLQEQNNLLTQQVAELEYQLEQAHRNTFTAAPTAAAPQPQPARTESVYTVAAGDTLWSIAQRQLGSGQRYREILELNPQLSGGTLLTVGTKITLPPK